MKLPITHKILQDWGGAATFRDGKALFDRGLVLEAEFEDSMMQGTLSWGSRSIRTAARILPDLSCENLCPCRDNVERGVICAHVIALGLALVSRKTDPDRERKLLEEERRARRLRQVAEQAFFRRTVPGSPGALDAALLVGLPRGWREAASGGKVPIRVFLEYGGQKRPIGETPRNAALGLTKKDDAVLFVLEEIAGGAVPDAMEVATADFINLLELHRGYSLWEEGGRDLPVNGTAAATSMRVDLDHENGELLAFLAACGVVAGTPLGTIPQAGCDPADGRAEIFARRTAAAGAAGAHRSGSGAGRFQLRGGDAPVPA